MWKRFWKKVNKTGTCWIWNGCVIKGGYGQFQNGNKIVYVHRLIYELFKGRILEGKVIDHLCKNRKCVNPNHLEAVTQKENVIRSKTILCKYRHDNWKFTGKQRQCKTCNNIRARRYRAEGRYER